MSAPVNVPVPCDGDAWVARKPWPGWDAHKNCDWCQHFHRAPGYDRGKCLGKDGWPILAAAGAEVARERGGKR